jgi:hypothetical protein
LIVKKKRSPKPKEKPNDASLNIMKSVVSLAKTQAGNVELYLIVSPIRMSVGAFSVPLER